MSDVADIARGIVASLLTAWLWALLTIAGLVVLPFAVVGASARALTSGARP